MSKKRGRWAPPLSGPSTNPGPSMTVMISDDEKAGKPLPPLVEILSRSQLPSISEAGPMPPDPAPPPFDRAAILAGLQSAFALLDDVELQVARMRMVRFPFWDIGEELGLEEDEVKRVWKRALNKLGPAVFKKT